MIDKWVELKLAGDWTDITDRVRGSAKINITRGKANEQSGFSPSRCSFIINNVDGDFSDVNQSSPYFGLIGPNTEIRVLTKRIVDTFTRTVSNGMGTGDSGQTYTITGTAANFDVTGSAFTLVTSTTSQAATTGLFGDVHIRAKMSASADTFMGLTKRMSNGDRISAFIDTALDEVRVSRITDGEQYNPGGYSTYTGMTFATDTAYWMILAIDEMVKVKVWEDGDAEPDDWQLAFWTDMTFNTNEDQLAPRNLTRQQGAVGMFAQSLASSETVTFDDFSAVEIRFHGEIPSWPPEWDNTGQDAYVRIEANGVTRRINTRSAPNYSPIRRSILGGLYRPLTGSYYPLEEQAASSLIRNAIKNAPDATMIGSMRGGGFSGIPGSDAIHVADAHRSGFMGSIDNDVVDMTGAVNFNCLYHVPEDGLPETEVIFGVSVPGSTSVADRWEISYSNSNGGMLRLRSISDSFGAIYDSGDLLFGDGVNGRAFALTFGLNQDGIGYDIRCAVTYIDANGDFANHGNLDTAVGTVGKPTEFFVKTDIGGAIGHITFGTWDASTSLRKHPQLLAQSTPFERGVAAYQGESTMSRFIRLCMEEGVWGQSTVDYDTLTPTCNDMGPQPRGTFMSLLQEVEVAEHGILYEPRDCIGYGLRTAYSLWNREALTNFDYSDAVFSGQLRPTNDDQFFKNSITVGRPSGARSQLFEVTSGRSSVDNRGEYRADPVINFHPITDDNNQAEYTLRFLSWDEQRIPTMQFDLHRDELSDEELALYVSMMDIGRVVTASSLPVWMQQGTVSEMIMGYTETIDNLTRTIVANTVPSGPYRVYVHEGTNTLTGFRLGWTDAKLSGSHNNSTTSLTVDKASGAFETGSDANFPYYIQVDYEVMEVTNITGSGPYTFTVQRGQRGTLAASHADDAAVLPYDFPVIGLAKRLN